MSENQFELGDELKCTITKFRGTATARTEFINGCVQYFLEPATEDYTKKPDGHWIDQQQLELVKAKAAVAPTSLAGGGFREMPK